jgi:hypothetical protein
MDGQDVQYGEVSRAKLNKSEDRQIPRCARIDRPRSLLAARNSGARGVVFPKWVSPGRVKLADGQRFAGGQHRILQQLMHVLRSIPTSALAATILAFASSPRLGGQYQSGQTPQNSQTSTKTSKTNQTVNDAGTAGRGKKLVLKDGTFQIAREYQRKGERVRYLSAERGDWEEIPAAMVDWDATQKAELAAASEENALLKTVHHEQVEQKAEMPMDVDASLPKEYSW